MKVYIIMYTHWDTTSLMAVFKTKELAEKACVTYVHDYYGPDAVFERFKSRFDIEEREVFGEE